MASGRLTSEQLTRAYIERIHALDSSGPGVNSIMELNPDALAAARQTDEQRRHGVVLGPLHGIPVLLKDNIDTGDRMQTSAGSFALVGTPAARDSTVAANLRAGGAVILGKARRLRPTLPPYRSARKPTAALSVRAMRTAWWPSSPRSASSAERASCPFRTPRTRSVHTRAPWRMRPPCSA